MDQAKGKACVAQSPVAETILFIEATTVAMAHNLGQLSDEAGRSLGNQFFFKQLKATFFFFMYLLK